MQEWFAEKLNEISNPESNQYLVPKLNTSKTDNNNLPFLVETLQQLGKNFLDISDNILLYLYLEVSILKFYKDNLFMYYLVYKFNVIFCIFRFVLKVFITYYLVLNLLLVIQQNQKF